MLRTRFWLTTALFLNDISIFIQFFWFYGTLSFTWNWISILIKSLFVTRFLWISVFIKFPNDITVFVTWSLYPWFLIRFIVNWLSFSCLILWLLSILKILSLLWFGLYLYFLLNLKDTLLSSWLNWIAVLI